MSMDSQPQASSPDAAHGGAAPRSERADALVVLNRLRDAGHEAYFAGGCVRDLLLGREPKDFDVATDAPPKRVRELFSNTQAVGAAFGVILVRYHGSVIEVATFRAEGPYLDGRHPTQVRFTTAQEDAQRRDFTINGLFLDPNDIRVIDYVGGQDDLKAKIIRAIGKPEARFDEDHLRMLRAARFASRFGFQIEPVTAAAIIRHAPQLARISPERIADELRAMLSPATRVVAYRILDELKLREIVFRFSPPSPRVGSGSRAVSVFDAVSPGQPISFGLALAAASLDQQLWKSSPDVDVRLLLERVPVQRMVHALRQSLKISNEESEQVQGSLEGLCPLMRDEPASVAVLKRFLARPTAALSRELLEALKKTVLKTQRVPELQQQLAELEKTEFAPLPFVTGDDLKAAGIEPGPKYKRILDLTYDAQLEARVAGREDAMDLALQLAREA